MVDRIFKAIDAVLAGLLLAMVLMVFGNVVLRYAFNSGLDVSEELSRYCFVWLTFIGAIVAMREGSHLGLDSFVSRLGRQGKIVCLVISNALILLCCSMLIWGTWLQHEIHATTASPVMGLPMIWVFGIGYVTGGAIAIQAIHTLWRIFTGRITDDELIEIRETEETLPTQEARA